MSMIGIRFGRLVVVAEAATIVQSAPKRMRYFRQSICRCDCGRSTTVREVALKSRNTRSCGCLHEETIRFGSIRHGDAKKSKWAAEYRTWVNMIARCERPSASRYSCYGGRGITVCARWRTSYENFLADMGRKPTVEHSIDRIDVNGNYEPDNCRWATRSEQARNTRRAMAKGAK